MSFLEFLAPIPTFYTIYKQKSSDGYQSIPYVVALLSASLLLYYGVLKTNATMIITINAIGIVIELTYLVLFLIYASTKEKMYTAKLILLFNVGGFGVTMALTILLLKGQNRVNTVGWICVAFSLAVFAAPLSIMRRVINTKSVEFMPFTPSFLHTLCATTWFLYGLFVNDMPIALPNILGLLFGIIQMILYMMYKDGNKKIAETNERNNQQEVSLDMKKRCTQQVDAAVQCRRFWVTMALTNLLLKGQNRVNTVGWICVAFSLSVFAVPLSIMRRVINTKSVEFMPFTPSFLHTLCAATWFLYGLFVNDMPIALPNILGLLFGIIQMILYMMYKDGNKKIAETNERNNQQEVSLDMKKKLTSIQSAKLYPASQY
ncbi:hypothetical protein NL676_020123 [Syzygium grande]|nr:hypothetical protein NL676_020123 [Syzygium grande]